MSPQTNDTPSPFARTEAFPFHFPLAASDAGAAGDTAAQPHPAARAVLPWWADGWLTKGFALMLGMIVMASLIFVSSLRAEREAEGTGRSASTKSGIVSGRATTSPNEARNARRPKSSQGPRPGPTKSGVID